MKKSLHLTSLVVTSAIVLASQNAFAQSSSGTRMPMLVSGVFYNWMSQDVQAAWNSSYSGQGVTVTVLDDFTSGSTFSGNFGDGTNTLMHGEWTRKEISMIAPNATMASQDFNTNTAVTLAPGLNVINMSYGMYAKRSVYWGPQEGSVINDARSGTAIVTKAAGNDSVAIGASVGGQKDYLDISLIGLPTAIFVGALNKNGSPTDKATLAWYSNYAGSDRKVQAQFLVVGVAGDQTTLYGTSFAAPIIAGYAAILGSKFTRATPVQITNQLLNTARQDTLKNYSAAIYGRGEASLSRSLAPVSIR